MKALSIQQPWAWAILYFGKPIENRTWYTNFRGRILIHAGKKYDKEGERFIQYMFGQSHAIFIPESQCLLGGIVGEIDIVNCVTQSDSPWFFGPYGFVLKNPKPLPFMPMRGQLGFFEVDYNFPPIK